MKKPKKSTSGMTLAEKEAIARQTLTKHGYSEKEIEKIIIKAFYTSE